MVTPQVVLVPLAVAVAAVLDLVLLVLAGLRDQVAVDTTEEDINALYRRFTVS